MSAFEVPVNPQIPHIRDPPRHLSERKAEAKARGRPIQETRPSGQVDVGRRAGDRHPRGQDREGPDRFVGRADRETALGEAKDAPAAPVTSKPVPRNARPRNPKAVDTWAACDEVSRGPHRRSPVHVRPVDGPRAGMGRDGPGSGGHKAVQGSIHALSRYGWSLA